jgi:two-component system, response regulator PdtaR
MNTKANPNPPAILIVDDAPSIRSALRAFFNSEGYRVVGDLAHCTGVIEAIGYLKPTIVCLDYELPDGNGIDLLRKLHAEHPNVAVVMITGNTTATLEAEAAEAGAAGFLRKPFSQASISREICQILQLQSLQRNSATAAPVATARARAVVVDDSATLRKLLVSILYHAGIEVVGEAPDGQRAIEAVDQLKPDIVCLDVNMPVMNGLDALEQIHRKHPTVKVMMVTGHADREMVKTAALRGARGYILKPFVPEKVIEAINKLLD